MLLSWPPQQPGAEQRHSERDPRQPSPPTPPHASGAACSGPTDPGLRLLGTETHSRPGSPSCGQAQCPPASSAAQSQSSSWVKFLAASVQEQSPEQAARGGAGAPAGLMASLLLPILQGGPGSASPVLPRPLWEPVCLLTPRDLWGPSEKSHTGLWGKASSGLICRQAPCKPCLYPLGDSFPSSSLCVYLGVPSAERAGLGPHASWPRAQLASPAWA